jgi:hypothetical protein
MRVAGLRGVLVRGWCGLLVRRFTRKRVVSCHRRCRVGGSGGRGSGFAGKGKLRRRGGSRRGRSGTGKILGWHAGAVRQWRRWGRITLRPQRSDECGCDDHGMTQPLAAPELDLTEFAFHCRAGVSRHVSLDAFCLSAVRLDGPIPGLSFHPQRFSAYRSEKSVQKSRSEKISAEGAFLE